MTVMTVYHGASDLDLVSIRQYGLDPVRAAAHRTFLGATHLYESERASMVFVTTALDVAVWYADEAVAKHGGAQVVFTIELPEAALINLREDRLDVGALGFDGMIPPEWITSVRQLDVAGATLTEVKR